MELLIQLIQSNCGTIPFMDGALSLMDWICTLMCLLNTMSNFMTEPPFQAHRQHFKWFGFIPTTMQNTVLLVRKCYFRAILPFTSCQNVQSTDISEWRGTVSLYFLLSVSKIVLCFWYHSPRSAACLRGK
jgi:hypothetical protein